MYRADQRATAVHNLYDQSPDSYATRRQRTYSFVSRRAALSRRSNIFDLEIISERFAIQTRRRVHAHSGYRNKRESRNRVHPTITWSFRAVVMILTKREIGDTKYNLYRSSRLETNIVQVYNTLVSVKLEHHGPCQNNHIFISRFDGTICSPLHFYSHSFNIYTDQCKQTWSSDAM